MKSIDDMLVPASDSLKVVNTRDNSSNKRDTADRAGLPDAINQMFAEFELAYHNQFRKAWPTEGELRMAKKYWCEALGKYSPAVILKATRQVTTTQTFLPVLSTLTSACENAMTLFGLPSAEEAYREACLAPAPKAAYNWSHPAVYLAGKACDWYALSSRTEDSMFRLFEYHYRTLCNQALNGSELKVPEFKALPETLPEAPLTAEQQKERLAALRKALESQG